MVRHDIHSFTEVEAVSMMTLHTGIKMQYTTLIATSTHDQPIEHYLSGTLRALLFISDEVINI